MLSSVEDDNERLRSRISALESENDELKQELQKWIHPKAGHPRGLLHSNGGHGFFERHPAGLLQSCCDANPNEAPGLGLDTQFCYDVSPQTGMGFGLFSCCQNVGLTQRPIREQGAPKGHKTALQKAHSHGGGETSALIPVGGGTGYTDSTTCTASSIGFEMMRHVTKKSDNVDFDGRLVCFRKLPTDQGLDLTQGAAQTSVYGGIQFEQEAEGESLCLTVALNTLPSESGCFLGFAPANVDLKESPFAPSKGYFLYVRHQTLYAQDGTIGREFSKEKFLLLASQRLSLRWDKSARVIRLFKDGQHLGECRFERGSLLPGNVDNFLPTILFGNHDTTLTLPDEP